MEKIEITKEMDYTLEWVGNNSKEYAFIPDMLLAFTKDYNKALNKSENVVLDGVSERTWKADEIINQLYEFENIEEAKRWFNEYGC